MKKKAAALMMAVVMTAALITGCGNDGSGSTSTNESAQSESKAETAGEVKTESDEGSNSADANLKEYTMAVNFPESGLTSFEILRSNMDTLEEMTNGTFVNAASEMTPDGVLSFVESQVAAGVDGLIICPPSDSVLPTVTQMCEEAGVYWGITLRSITDPEIKAMVEASPYYVGNCYEDEENAGYTCGKWMGDAGYKKIAIISQAKGDTTCDTRELGLSRACEEFGIEIVGESRGHSQASDTTAAVESFLASNADLDAVFFIGSACTGSHEATVKAIQDAGRQDDVKMVTIDFPDQMVADFESGVLVYSYAASCLTLDPFVCLIEVVNAIQGTPIGDGVPTSNIIGMFGIDNLETAIEYQNETGSADYEFFDEETLHKMFKWENPDLNQETLQEILDSYKPL